jgi:hypothetical protein
MPDTFPLLLPWRVALAGWVHGEEVGINTLTYERYAGRRYDGDGIDSVLFCAVVR